MAIERAPDASVGSTSELINYTPPDYQVGKYHVVQPGYQENWGSVAQSNAVDVAEMIAFNFPGSVVNGRIQPPIVNWYLGQHVNFKCPETRDGKNRMFKGGERVAIPLKTTHVDVKDPLVITTPVPKPAPKPTGIWFGGGYKAGTTFGVVGIETTQIVCVRADGAMGFTATVSGSRFPALGLGASGGPILVFITSMNHPSQLEQLMTGGKEFSLAIGAKLESFIGSAKYGKAIKALADFSAKYGRAGAAGVKAGQQIVKYNSQLADLVKVLGMKTSHYEPQVFSLGSPWGGFGLEASVHFTVSKFMVEGVHKL